MKINYLFRVSLILILLFLMYMFFHRYSWKIKTLEQIRHRSLYGKLVITFEKWLLPHRARGLYQWYEKRLKYTKWTVGKFFTWKIMFLIVILLMSGMIRMTDVRIDSSKIFQSYQYHRDPIFSNSIPAEQEDQALAEEIYYLRQAITSISQREFYGLDKTQAEGKIYEIIDQSGRELLQPKRLMANKIYYRLYDYYQIREYNMTKYLLGVLLLSFIPEVCLQLNCLFIAGDKKRELRFLKRLMILNGSIKPVDFMEVLVRLIDKSRYYEKILKAIERENKKNTISNQTIYRQYIRGEKDIEVKLFLEKLDQANNYDFDQAIINIENEFKLERRQQIRRVRKQIELIHVWGIVGSFLLIALLTIYMLRPWLSAYDMNQFI